MPHFEGVEVNYDYLNLEPEFICSYRYLEQLQQPL
jgi:hypothetical protein